MTKALTATAAMQLVEQGKLQLDEPISKVLPELAAPQVLEGFDDKGQPKLRPAKRPITLRQLLTHTAGFTYDLWDADTAQYVKAANLPGIISCKNAALRRRSHSIRAIAGSTASTSISPARRSRRSADRVSTSICASTFSSRSA